MTNKITEEVPLLAANKDEQMLEKVLVKTDARRGSIDAPKDTYNLAYIIFYLQGLGCLVPWNAFITVNAYFHAKLVGSQFKDNVLPYYTSTFQVINIILLVCATRIMGKVSMKLRIGVPMLIQLIIFILILLMVKHDIEGDEFFYATLLLVVLSAATTSFYQGGLFGLSGMLPFEYTQAMMGGQGLGGVTVAVMNLLTLALLKDPIDAAFVFFLVAVLVLVACNISFYILLNLPVVKFYVRAGNANGPDPAGVNSYELDSGNNGQLLASSEIFRKIAPMALSVCAIFAVTLAIFPSIAVTIRSEDPDSMYGEKLFIPLYCFLMFNLGDLSGRTLAGKVQWPPATESGEPSLMKYPVIARLAFIPLFLLCNVHTGLPSADHERDLMPVIFHSDAIPFVLMYLLGLTNGYWATLCMMYGPGMVEQKDGERAGSIMLLLLVIGLGIGSLMSFVLLAIVCQCNSFIGAPQHLNTTAPTAAPSAVGLLLQTTKVL